MEFGASSVMTGCARACTNAVPADAEPEQTHAQQVHVQALPLGVSTSVLSTL
jgi:hypothetical protein